MPVVKPWTVPKSAFQDVEIKGLLNRVITYANLTKQIWQQVETFQECVWDAGEVILSWPPNKTEPAFGTVVRQTVVVNDRGFLTFIPSYSNYSENWSKSLLVNPFEFNWNDHSTYDMFTFDYMDSIIKTMSEQLDLWTSDGIGVDSEVVYFFGIFLDALKDFKVILNSYTEGYNN